MMYGKKVVALAAVCAMTAGVTSTAYAATSTFEMRKKAVNMLGIMSTGDLQANVSRAEFARMLVNASEYRHTAGSSSNVSVYADVLSTSEYASSIRTVSANSWMSGYLGGNFKPDQGVTLREASRAVLTLLGYSNDDFAGNINENRMAKFSALGLDTNIKKDSNEVLTRTDCVNLFYNLMKAKTKTGAKYGTQVFSLGFTSEGEINMSTILDSSIKGPKLLGDYGEKELDDIVPFSLKNASLFLDGYSSDEDEINDNALIVYYHEETKTVFAYSDDGENKGATEGEIQAIYYDSTDPFTPVSVILDTENQEYAEDGDVFKLNSSEIQYLFSIYGDFKVGDDVVIIWEKNGIGENATYTAIDVVGDY